MVDLFVTSKLCTLTFLSGLIFHLSTVSIYLSIIFKPRLFLLTSPHLTSLHFSIHPFLDSISSALPAYSRKPLEFFHHIIRYISPLSPDLRRRSPTYTILKTQQLRAHSFTQFISNPSLPCQVNSYPNGTHIPILNRQDFVIVYVPIHFFNGCPGILCALPF